MDTTPSFPSEQQLAQMALEKVRALCKGNGVKVDTITVISQTMATHTLNAGTYLELKPITSEKSVPGKVTVGMMVASRDEAMKQVDQAMVAIARDPAIKAQITSTLLARPDQGFGLSGQVIPLEFLKKEFTYHDGCGVCRGSGQSPCLKCHGRRVETCVKCSGKGMMFCPLCRGTGLLQGAKCTKCMGQRYYPCDMCRKTGMMKCRTCHGQGATKCATCGGQGAKSQIISLLTTALTYFEYEAKSIPKGAADMIESQGATLAKDNRIKLIGRVADDKENALGASYEVTFPYGDMVFSIAKKDVKAGVFGYKADLVNFPLVLDRLVQKGVDELEDAAGDVGSVADKIKKATRYRLIAQAFLLSTKTSNAKAVAMLMQKYDVGLSHTMAEKIVTLADNATGHITKKPRLHGLLAGLAGSVVMIAGYYLAPIRSTIAGYFPNPWLDGILDILPIVLGGVLTTFAVQMMAAGSVRTALGHLIPKDKKNTLIPKAGNAAWIGYIGAAVLCIIMMEVCVKMGQAAPHWYKFLRDMIVPPVGL